MEKLEQRRYLRMSSWEAHERLDGGRGLVDARVTLSITRYRLVTSSGGTRATLVNRIAWIVNDAAFERPLAWLISFVLVYKICYVPRELHDFGNIASYEEIDFLFLLEFLTRILYYEFHLYVELSMIQR